MTFPVQAFAVVLPGFYFLTALLYGMELAGPRAPQAGRWRRLSTAVLVLVHCGLAAGLGFRLGHLPVTGPWSVVSLVALAILLLYLLLERLAGTPTTGAFVLGATGLLQLLASSFMPLEPEPSARAASPFFVVHALSATFAVAALLLSGFYGGVYLVLLRQIRGRRFGVLFAKLPDLETLSRLYRGAAGIGFILLTAGLNLGIWWAHSGAVLRFDYLDPKVLPILIAWVIFGVIGASRWVRFLSGRRAAVIAVAAAAFLVLAMIVSLVPAGAFHAFRSGQ